MRMKNSNNLDMLLAIAIALICGCKKKEPSPIVPPAPSTVSVRLGDHLYNCANTITGMDNPGSLVFANTGKLRVAVTGTSTPQFSQSTSFEKNTFPSPTLYTAQNGTSTNNSHKLQNDGCLTFEVPINESCNITASFREGQGIGTGACLGPAQGLCFRWLKTVNIAANQLFGLNCANAGNFVFIIDQQNPQGFIGSCN